MSDDTKNTNPLDTSITNLRDLLKHTESDIERAQRELAEAEENGTFEDFLASHSKQKKSSE